MIRVQAYWGKRQTTPKACPIGKRCCYREGKDAEPDTVCDHYHIGSLPQNGRNTGSVRINCDAKKRKAKP